MLSALMLQGESSGFGLAINRKGLTDNLSFGEDVSTYVQDPVLLYDCARLLSSDMPLQQLFRQLLEHVVLRVGATLSATAKFHANRGTLSPVAVFFRRPPEGNRPSPPQFELAQAPRHRQAITFAQTIVVRQDVPELAMDDRERELAGVGRFKSACLVPLVAESQSLGVLTVSEEREWSRAPFTPERVRMFEVLGAQIAAALTRFERQEQAERRARQAKMIAEVSRRLAQIESLDELAHLALEQISLNFECQTDLFLFQSETGHALCWSTSAATWPVLAMAGEPLNVGGADWVQRTLSAGQKGLPADPLSETEPSSQRALIAVPIKCEGTLAGILRVRAERADAFDYLDRETLETLAAQFAAAIKAERARAALRQHGAYLTMLQGLSRQVIASRSVHEVYRSVYDSVNQLMDSDAFFIALRDEKSDESEFVFRIENRQTMLTERFALGEGVMNYVMRSSQAVLVPDVAEEKRFQVTQADIRPSVRSLVCVPLEFSDHTIGALSTQSYRRSAYTDIHLQVLTTFAGQVAAAIHSRRLLAASQRRMEQLAVLNEVGRIVSSTIEIDRLLDLIYDQVRRILPADTYYVALVDAQKQSLEIKVLVDDGERFPPTRIPLGDGLASIVVLRGAPLLLPHARDESPRLGVTPLRLGRPHPSESWLGVPMMTSNQLLGVLAVASYLPEAFDESDQEILQSVAIQAAIAIDNARHRAQLEEQARSDSLTQVLNHGYFLVRLRAEVQRATETAQPLSVIMLDIDHFKGYNDRYGHLAGDAILRETVQAIRTNIKHADLVGRWGGEEFAIALPGTGRSGARIVAERIRKTLAEMKLVDEPSRPVPVPTVSQGIASLPDDANEAMALVDIADRRLYEAKGRGRDQVSAGGEE